MTLHHLGPWIARERSSQGLTQIQLAHRAGVSRNWLIRLEGGSLEDTRFAPVARTLRVLGYALAPVKTL